jgi:hypothetical protein
MKSEILRALLEFLRSRTGKRDVVKDAIRSKDRAVRLIAVILALAPSVIAMLAAYLAWPGDAARTGLAVARPAGECGDSGASVHNASRSWPAA